MALVSGVMSPTPSIASTTFSRTEISPVTTRSYTSANEATLYIMIWRVGIRTLALSLMCVCFFKEDAHADLTIVPCERLPVLGALQSQAR